MQKYQNFENNESELRNAQNQQYKNMSHKSDQTQKCVEDKQRRNLRMYNIKVKKCETQLLKIKITRRYKNLEGRLFKI